MDRVCGGRPKVSEVSRGGKHSWCWWNDPWTCWERREVLQATLFISFTVWSASSVNVVVICQWINTCLSLLSFTDPLVEDQLVLRPYIARWISFSWYRMAKNQICHFVFFIIQTFPPSDFWFWRWVSDGSSAHSISVNMRECVTRSFNQQLKHLAAIEKNINLGACDDTPDSTAGHHSKPQHHCTN